MITPAFELSQDPDFLTLVVRVPYTRTSEFDVYVDGEDFKFYAKPYFLRLTLPGRIVQDGREKASFDIDKGLFTMRVPKETAGQHFEGLEMLTSLLAPKGSRSAKPLVEDLGACGGSEAVQEDEDEEEDFDWQLEQKAYVESSEDDLKKLQKYGFGNLRTGVFSRLQEELSDVTDVKDPENSSPTLRRRNRLDAETTIFCADHYLCDLYEGEETRNVLLSFRPWWSELKPDSDQPEATVTFTDDEKEQMRKFTNRSYPLDKAARYQVWLGLVDIILAYVYDVRTTEGEHNVESAWTIRKLSGTLSWLETYHSVQEVLVSFGRRVLCYPLYRHFSLITTAVKDAAHIFQCGKACILKCLLAVHKIFRENEPAYILNDLYITDYCIWIQRVKSKHVVALADPLRKAKLHKDHLDLELAILEEAAELVIKEEEEQKEEETSSSSSEGEEKDSSSSSSEGEEEDSSSSSSEGEEEDSSVPQLSDTQENGGEPKGVGFQPEPSPGALKTGAPTTTSPRPQESKRLIQELSERVEEGLRIEEDVPQTSRSSSSRDTEREAEGLGETDEPAAAGETAKTGTSSALLETRPRKCPLRVIGAEELDSDDEDETNH
ncbi:protein SHQ1 homolog [Pygocentrus nattereri]|uniref:Protein SHQ1 homolog n=1 Tax=Pygocentrus nattereri TaxID=42514 RepID=A0AAR2KX27_PYGNA|nr:protein SHQ1 homolog [Pygocentrus nattereri]XP_037390656.1 protein SHQ1 homolog [Pygocentrus nattereri]